MKKFACKISALLCVRRQCLRHYYLIRRFCCGTNQKVFRPHGGFGVSWQAYSVKTILPANYDVTEAQVKANGGVFGANSDKRALAAFKTNKTTKLFKEVFGNDYSRAHTLMKNYVARVAERFYERKRL